MRYIANFLFFIYQTLIKLIFLIIGVKNSASCRFYPTCSKYSQEVFKKYGFLKGFWLSIQRILKCHPWSKGGVDLPHPDFTDEGS